MWSCGDAETWTALVEQQLVERLGVLSGDKDEGEAVVGGHRGRRYKVVGGV